MIGVTEVRKIEKEDWSSIREMLSNKFSKKRVKERMAYFIKLWKSGSCDTFVGLVDFNIVGFCIKKSDKTIEMFIAEDYQESAINKKLK